MLFSCEKVACTALVSTDIHVIYGCTAPLEIRPKVHTTVREVKDLVY